MAERLAYTVKETAEKHYGRIASFRTIAEAEQQAQSWLTDGRAEKVKVYWAEGRWWASETPKRGGAKIAGNNQS